MYQRQIASGFALCFHLHRLIEAYRSAENRYWTTRFFLLLENTLISWESKIQILCPPWKMNTICRKMVQNYIRGDCLAQMTSYQILGFCSFALDEFNVLTITSAKVLQKYLYYTATRSSWELCILESIVTALEVWRTHLWRVVSMAWICSTTNSGIFSKALSLSFHFPYVFLKRRIGATAFTSSQVQRGE